MKPRLANPGAALAIGVVACVIMLILWSANARGDHLGLISFVTRLIHVLAAMVWIGLIWFVNFIQFRALQTTDGAGRTALLQHVVPNVAATFRAASYLTLASGIVLLVTSGYLLDRWVYPSAVYTPPAKMILLWCGVAAGLLMWLIVNLLIWPQLAIVLGQRDATESERDIARRRVQIGARINLVLSLPVTFAMVGAGHLY